MKIPIGISMGVLILYDLVSETFTLFHPAIGIEYHDFFTLEEAILFLDFIWLVKGYWKKFLLSNNIEN